MLFVKLELRALRSGDKGRFGERFLLRRRSPTVEVVVQGNSFVLVLEIENVVSSVCRLQNIRVFFKISQPLVLPASEAAGLLFIFS
jgi:hypothetical protein